jgi:hypothetical protein
VCTVEFGEGKIRSLQQRMHLTRGSAEQGSERGAGQLDPPPPPSLPPPLPPPPPGQIDLSTHRLELHCSRLELLRSRLTSDAAGSSRGAADGAAKKDRPPATAAWRRELPGDGNDSGTWSSASPSSADVPARPARRRPRSQPPPCSSRRAHPRAPSAPAANARLYSRRGRLRPPTCSSFRLRRASSLPSLRPLRPQMHSRREGLQIYLSSLLEGSLSIVFAWSVGALASRE